jgi:hypothetical protein
MPDTLGMRERALIWWTSPLLAALIAAGYLVWWWISHARRG